MPGASLQDATCEMVIEPGGPSRPAFLYGHADDMVLGAALAAMRASGSGLDLLLCSAAPESVDETTHWDGICGVGRPAEAMATRLDEHRRACDRLGLTTIGLGGYDGQYDVAETRDDRESVVLTACDALREWGADCLFTHSPMGTHPDHLRAHAAAASIVERTGLPLVVTCDRPYEPCDERHCPHLAAGTSRTSVLLSDAEWELKRAAFGMYASQTGPLQDGWGAARFESTTLGRECYTTLTSATPKEMR